MITYLKLGGSLITDKDKPHTAHINIIQRLAAEICEAQKKLPNHQFIFGHGSGSFGHVPAEQYGTRLRVHTPAEWAGFVDVWQQARDLNQIVLKEFNQAGVPVMAFPPSAIISSAGGIPASIQAEPIKSAIQAGITPIVGGDVIFDSVTGGTIFSTEDVFMALAPLIPPDRILLCGKDEGVYEDYPQCTRIVQKITPSNYQQLSFALDGSSSVDVTGGMREKVELMLKLVNLHPQTQIAIFSGLEPGKLYDVLVGAVHGTIISYE